MRLDEIRSTPKTGEFTFGEAYPGLKGVSQISELDTSRGSLTSLEGCPENFVDDFVCTDNKLSSLRHGPKHVGGKFDVSSNPLQTLAGAPLYVGGDFCLYDCNFLESLDGMPPYAKYNYVVASKCTILKSLGVLPSRLTHLNIADCPIENIGNAFSKINEMGNIRLTNTSLTSFDGDFPKKCNYVRIVADIPSFHDIHRRFKRVSCFNLQTRTRESILGLALIEGLDTDSLFNFYLEDAGMVRSTLLNAIVFKHAGKGRQTLMSFQNELLDNGFDEFARL